MTCQMQTCNTCMPLWLHIQGTTHTKHLVPKSQHIQYLNLLYMYIVKYGLLYQKSQGSSLSISTRIKQKMLEC